MLNLRRAALVLLGAWAQAGGAYENFQVAVYTRAQEVVRMSDPAWLEREWQRIALPAHAWRAFRLPTP